MKKISLLTIATVALALTSCSDSAKKCDKCAAGDADIEARIEDALSKMTLHEKIGVIHAQSKFSSAGVPRLGIPELWCTDGPHGIRPEVLWDEWDQAGWTNDSCVAFPALTCLAATWNQDLGLLYGKSIGEEARYRNKAVLLGPGVNICRTPLNGRSFEYLGEDPYLSGRMAVGYVKGVQSNGVAVCVKHYALNNNEVDRYTTNAIADERTLREIYLPAFKAAVVEGGAWSIMGGYNLFRGQHACHNDYLMNKVLKGEWGFDGAVISDWGGTQSTEEAIFNSLDLEYGTWTDGLKMGLTNAYDNYYMARPYEQLINEGKVGTKELDDKVRRVLRLIFRTTGNQNRPLGSLCSDEHYAAAQKIGEEGIVLLKNEANLLPLNLEGNKKIAVIGENAIKMMTVGGGSSSLKVQHEISPLHGLKKRLAGKAEVVYARGYVGDATGEYNGVTTGQNLTDNRPAEVIKAEAVKLASESDVVIFIGGLNKADHMDAEGSDRLEYALPYGQNELVEALLEANKNLVVVNISGNAVAMPWADKVSTIVQDWYLGSEAGTSLASVLVGDVNPSGHLPMTWYASLDQNGAHATGAYPGVKRNDGSGITDLEYAEGIFVGYRYVEKNNLQPLFPFGHGLSYTTFAVDNAKIKTSGSGDSFKATVTADVTNTGNVDGAEVVQLYISDVECSVARPVKELKGFAKTYLKAGEKQTVEFEISSDALKFYDEAKGWIAESGKFEVLLGVSSADIRQTLDFDY